MTPIGNRSLLPDLRWGDGILLLLFLISAYYVWQWKYNSEGDRLLVEIQQEAHRSFYPLAQDRDLSLQNSSGQEVMLVKFRNAKVWVQESNCPLQYCVLRGAIDRIGQWIACLPNRVFIRILAAKSAQEGAENSPFALDAEVF